jgi:hypothetical protein
MSSVCPDLLSPQHAMFRARQDRGNRWLVVS